MMKSFDDWKKSSKSKKLLLKVQKEIRKLAPNADVILYGSRVRGNAKLLSDWDFIILVDEPLTRNLIVNIQDCLYEIELETDTVLSSIIRTRKVWDSPKYSVLPFRQSVEQEGVLL